MAATKSCHAVCSGVAAICVGKVHAGEASGAAFEAAVAEAGGAEWAVTGVVMAQAAITTNAAEVTISFFNCLRLRTLDCVVGVG